MYSSPLPGGVFKIRSVHRIAMSLLHSSQDAEDAVSDAIEATWKNLWRIRNTRQLKPGAHFLLHVLCYLKH
jgi:DNA-directed RNA polymerase specialized sigma24 family protein